MKKILIICAALAFANSTFISSVFVNSSSAANVTGYAIAGYIKRNNEAVEIEDPKSLYAESEIDFAGSKRSDSLTFGATFTVGQSGINASRASYDYTDDPDGIFENGAYSHFKTFISGGFGKITFGRQNLAAREIGPGSLLSGLGPIDWAGLVLGSRDRIDSGITFLSPTAFGFQMAYTLEPNTKRRNSMALRYGTVFSGISLNIAYGTYQRATSTLINDGETPERFTDYAIKVGYSGFSISYAVGKEVNDTIEAAGAEDTDYAPNIIGFDYKSGNFAFGAALANNREGYKSVVFNVGYTITSGLDVFLENLTTTHPEDDAIKKSSLFVGTNISF